MFTYFSVNKDIGVRDHRQVESSTPSDQQQRRPDGQKFDDDVAQKEGDGWLSEDAVDCKCLRMICSIPSSTEELCPAYVDELSYKA